MLRKLTCIAIILICISSFLIACDNNCVDNENDKPNPDGIPPWIGLRVSIESFYDYCKDGFRPILPKHDGWSRADRIETLYQYYSELNAPKIYRGHDNIYEAYEICVVFPNPQNNLEFYGLDGDTFSNWDGDFILSEIVMSPDWSTQVGNDGNTTVVYDAYTDIMANYSDPYPRILRYLKNKELGFEPKAVGVFNTKEKDIKVSLFTYTKDTKYLTGDYIDGFRETMGVKEFYYTTYIGISEFRIDDINYMIAIPIVTVFHKDRVSDADYLARINEEFDELEYGSEAYYIAINNTDKLLDGNSFAKLKDASLRIQTDVINKFIE